MGKINSRFEYFVRCAEFQNSFLPNKFKNKGNFEDRCNSTGEIRTWGISEQFILRKQIGGRSLTCKKSQITEQLHTLPTFQNGRDAFNKGCSPRTSPRRFDKDRSKRCLFCHTNRKKLQKIYSFSMGRKFIGILLLMSSAGSSPSDFHKTSKDPNCLMKEDQCKNNSIFGRQASNSPNVERNFASEEDIDFSVTEFRFCDKF